MIRLKRNMILAFMFSLLFFFTVAQAQVEDTTDTERPAETEFETPRDMDTETGMPNTQTGTQRDTTGKYAAHFQIAEEMAERLGQTLNITEEQKSEIIERIVEFHENIADVNMEMREGEDNTETQQDLDAELVSLVDDVESVLDESQRADWIRMKNDWMNEVKAHVQSGRDVQRQDSDEYPR